MKRTASFTAAELFAGIGLVRYALEQHKWEVVFANDYSDDKAAMYRDNWPDNDHLVVKDIAKLQESEIPSCDLITACFPCNDLSIAGKWKGLKGKNSSTFWEVIRLLREMGDRKPKFVLLENVVGFLMSRQGKDLELALAAFNELGYAVDAFILNAARWVPQSRARLFVVAQLGEGEEAEVEESEARPKRLAAFINDHPKIRWKIRELPKLPKLKKKLDPDILEDLSDNDPQWWSDERARYFVEQLGELHAKTAERMIAGKKYTYATAFRRMRNEKSTAELRTDGVAGCLRTPRGGSARQILFKAGHGKYKVRLLTARECARLQGVPDRYVIGVSLNKALFGFGDATCVPVLKWITSRYLAPVMGEIASQS
jgi:DNA (cytosine-5)-methyltransferase 1